jgi:integrase
MKGSIRQRSKGSWEITVDLGRDSVTGKRKRHFETIQGRKSDAHRRLIELLANLERGIYVKPQHLNVKELLYHWLEGYVKTKCSARTLDGYKSIVDNHLAPAFGHVPLRQFQPQHIQEYYSYALTEKHLSSRTVHHQHRVLSEALRYGVRQGWLARNPCEFVDPPRAKKRIIRTLIPYEIKTFLGVGKNNPYYGIFFMALNTGLRQAELLGLRWRDVDIDMLSLSVSQTLYKRRGICQFKEPKSDHSRRKVSLTPRLALFLRRYKHQKEIERMVLGKPLTADDLVFSDIEGRPIDPGTLVKNFGRVARRAGLSGIRFHDLRHTFASLMLAGGVNPKIVSEALGHSSVAFTLDVYSHLVPNIQRAAMKRLDEILGQAIVDDESDVGKMSAEHPNLRRDYWQGWQDSNPRPAVLETAALPN